MTRRQSAQRADITAAHAALALALGSRRCIACGKSDKTAHDLDYSEIDELDEISGDEQMAFIWCNTHHRYEWHWIDRSMIRSK